MTALVLLANSASQRRSYINGSPSNTVTNTTTETAFDQVFTLPSQSQQTVTQNTAIRLQAWGIMSSGLLNLGFTFRLRWGGISGTIIATTGSINVASSLSDNGWFADAVIMIRSTGASGTAEAQSFLAMQSGALGSLSSYMSNTTTFAIDTTVPNDLQFTGQWGVSVGANSIQMRALLASIDFP